MFILIFIWQGILDAVHCKALYGEGVGSGNEEQINQDRDLCLPISVLVLLHCF